MARETQYKKSFSGSIGSGMKSIMGSNGRRFYVLEHKVSSKYHKAGESQQIIVDQIELGRGSECQVRFDETFATVSRRHAAIVKDGDNWKLIHLSQVNSTYLNGHKVQKEWYLQSGDEIQLSTNGPKLGFIIPQGEKGLVKSIGLTARMNLFRQQALRPYKTAISILSVIFVLAIAAGVWALKNQHDIILKERESLATYKQEVALREASKDSIISNLQANNELLVSNDKKRNDEMERLKKRMKEFENRPAPTPQVTNSVDNTAIDACLPGVYYIQSVYFELTLPDGSSGKLNCGEEYGDADENGNRRKVPRWSGSGFLLNNGKFVTARHVIEAWSFWQDGDGVNEDLAMLNAIANNGGKVVAHLIAVSSSGNKLNLSSDKFRVDSSRDTHGTTENGTRLSLASIDDTDFAFANVGSASGGLQFDAEKSRNLNRGEKLTVLGFPLGLGVNSSGVNPVYGSAIVAASGLQDGIILTTDTNYEHGNSGGPVFYTDPSGKLVVIGIVSAGAGRTIGCIVPISKIE